MKTIFLKVCSVAVVLLKIEVVFGCTSTSWGGDCTTSPKSYCCSSSYCCTYSEYFSRCTSRSDCSSSTKSYCCSGGNCCTFSEYYSTSTSTCTLDSDCTSFSKPNCCSGGSCCSYSVYTGSSTITKYWNISIGAIVGIVIGVIVLIVASVVGCVYCCCRPNRTNQGVVIGATATTTTHPVAMPQYPGNYGYDNVRYPGQAPPPTYSTAADPSFMPPPYPKEAGPPPY